jgi:hypothetical protein
MPVRKKAGVPIPAPPPAAAAAPASVSLPVPYVKQEQTEWCWAACTQMVSRWLGVADVPQCELANFLHGQTNCCVKPSSDTCNQPAPLNGVMPVYRHVGVKGIGPDRPLLFNTLVAELAAGRAVEVAFAWFGGGGHVVVVYGYDPEGQFAVRDPWFGSGSVTYLDLFSAYGNGRWVVSYGRFARA